MNSKEALNVYQNKKNRKRKGRGEWRGERRKGWGGRVLNVSNAKTRVNVGRHCLFPQIAMVDNQELGSVGYVVIATSKTKSELAHLNS